MLEVKSVSKKYSTKTALENVSFKVETGSVAAILGPSASGKSTLLSIIAGLEEPDEGQVSWDRMDLSATPVHQRDFGLMFQDNALFPHRDVSGNAAFGLEMKGESRSAITKRVREILALVGLSGFERRQVTTLSGGEQQRVALARALAPRPRLLMLDEPLGSLDRSLRERLLNDLSGILRQSGQTSLYVTHDQEEAFSIADQIIVLQAGKVAQDAAPRTLFLKPSSPFVASFLGLQNLFPATVESGRLQTPFGEFELAAAGGKVIALLRPDAIELGDKASATLSAQLVNAQFHGNQTVLEVKVGGQLLRFSVSSKELIPSIGQTIQLSFRPERAFQLFPRE